MTRDVIGCLIDIDSNQPILNLTQKIGLFLPPFDVEKKKPIHNLAHVFIYLSIVNA